MSETAEATVSDLTVEVSVEKALKLLAEGFQGHDSEGFFSQCVRLVAAALGMKYVLVAEVLPNPPERARSLAFWSGEGPGPEFDYILAGTPCAETQSRALCFHPAGVADLFPEDGELRAMGVSSYVGIPLRDSLRRPVGILCAMDPRPMKESTLAGAVLHLFAETAGREIERLRLKAALGANAARQARRISDLSREIRTAVTGVLGATSLLLSEPIDDEQRELAVMARESAERLLSGIERAVRDQERGSPSS